MDHHVQNVLGSEGISLEFRHIASYLLYYCQHHSQQAKLLNLVITLVGYFTANNPDNQNIVQSGSQPSVLQQDTPPLAIFHSSRAQGSPVPDPALMLLQ